MERPCPQCGNRQHAPGAIECRVCGAALSEITHPIERRVQNQGDYFHEDHYPQTSLSQLSPCLLDRNHNVYCLNKEGETLIGSHPTMDIHLNGSDVYSRHARIFMRGPNVFIEALSFAVLYVNSRAVVDKERQLMDRDIVKIGKTQEFVYLENSPQRIEIINDQDNYQQIESRDLVRRTEPTMTPQQRRPNNCDFYGTILQVEGPYSQKAEATTGKVLGDAFKIALAIWKPATIIFHKQQQPDQVRLIRVQSPDGEQRVVFMRGGYASGMIQMGDEVSFWGKWERGCLVMERAFNHSLNTWVMISK